jgi:signal transduction histidine kinase
MLTAMLHELLTARHDEIVARARVKVAARRSPLATDEELKHGVPLLLTQLVTILRRADGQTEDLTDSATLDGDELLRMGFTVAQVVYAYGDVCQVVAELARDLDAEITPEEYRVFNWCIDQAIARAVTEYERQREQATALKGTEEIGVFAHAIRNLLNTAVLSFDLIKEGHVTSRGSTAAILERSLKGMRDLVDRSLAEVRLQAHAHCSHPIGVAEFVEDVEIWAAADAKSRGLQLAVAPVPADLTVYGDRALLASAVSNLLQNAFKFTHTRSTVMLRTRATADRVLIEVHDECGGLPEGKAEELFRPFEQRSDDRSGVGLGLVIAQRAVQASGGSLYVRNFPGTGCVFTVDLPKLALPPASEAQA